MQRQQADKTFKQVENFLPMNLRWSYPPLGGVPEIFTEGISPEMGKHCDLDHITDPQACAKFLPNAPHVPPEKAFLELDFEFPPNTLGHILAPGVYRLHLRLAAANSSPVNKTVEITVTGDWYPDQEEMFSEAVGLRQV